MEITRIEEARPYDAARHHGMTALQLHGGDGSSAQHLSVGLSHFLPSGGAERSASPRERVYVVLQGEVTVTVEGEGEATLGPLDSCLIGAGEERTIENRTKLPVSMLVLMPQAEVK